MLETRELYKVYKPKKGVPVTAIDKVSLRFPDKGMVFLLGKSGSGKSTLLNLLGGLDKYDGGEIIIKGVSSKNFSQQRFDSYRNTYVGFIFQEYNILEEFSVGANIALALELQGRKATDEEINKILKEVDLEGYGNRKPNELSGGQKQRVAIARALVKNPEIIMADEPTGALDSNTGKQVFDTLKKLSRNKLVIIVSHDREFSEKYADRIIELADGRVISDVELDSAYMSSDLGYEGYEEYEGYETGSIDDNETSNIIYKGNIIELESGYHLTEEDRIAINKYIDDLNSGNVQLKIADKKDKARVFVPTNQERVQTNNKKEEFKLIKSKLPLKNAFKIGASSLKYKKFRLVMTILLSFVAFTLFGLSDTLGSYDHTTACTNSLIDNNVNHLSLVKAIKGLNEFEEYYKDYGNPISVEELAGIEKELGIDFAGVYVGTNGYREIFNLGKIDYSSINYNIYINNLWGFAEINQELISSMKYEIVAGKLPDGSKNEIALSAFVFESFKKYKYTDGTVNDKGEYIYTEINTYEDFIGKTVNLEGVDYVVTGIIDTHFNFDRYKVLMEKQDYTSTTEELALYALLNEYNYEVNYSLTGLAMTGEGFLARYMEMFPRCYEMEGYLSLFNENGWVETGMITILDNIEKNDIIWVDGAKNKLGSNEIIVSTDYLQQLCVDMETNDDGYFVIDENVLSQVKDIRLDGNYFNYEFENDEYYSDYKIVGLLPTCYSDKIVNKYDYVVVVDDVYADNHVADMNGLYEFIVGGMPEGEASVRAVVEATAGSDADVKYMIQNSVTYDLETINILIKAVAEIALYVGIGFAVFASLMLANFIGISIAHKKQEIGILRAIGARSNDVFTIFFSESFVIAIINFILATVATFCITNFINNTITGELGILITVLSFGVRQVLLLLGVSLAVAAVASFIPVKKIASKKPIDAIRNR